MKKTILLVCIFTACFFFAQSQPCRKEFKNCTNLHNYEVFRADTVIIRCDTAYILNVKTFRLYNGVYMNMKKGNRNFSEILKNYENLVAVQEENIHKLNMDYDLLKSRFDSVTAGSLQMIRVTGNSLGQLKDTLNSTVMKLDNANRLIAEAEKNLNALRKRQFQSGLIRGGIGFLAGLAAGIIVIEMIK